MIQTRTILVLGGDGYYGWPLALRLAIGRPDQKIIIVDNEWRRNTVRNNGIDSLIAVAPPSKRIKTCAAIYQQHNLHYVHADINTPILDLIIKEERPHTIYHLAQQSSAPYSMRGIDEALFTMQNNEGGNMRLLWAIRKHVPDAHLIKIGSFGEYAKGDIDIAEGYFEPEYRGRKASSPMPYPRESDDVYHISKINDSAFVSMACRKWGLRITDIMQATIFGVLTDEMQETPELYTRFDYDEIFGTVLNRFITQAIAGYPLTVYGTGNQRTGLMSLRDAVASLDHLADDIPAAGKHRVINHVTEKSYSINELATTVQEIARAEGYAVTIEHAHDPRGEQHGEKLPYHIETTSISTYLKHTPFKNVVKETFKLVARYRHEIVPGAFAPTIDWRVDDTKPAPPRKPDQMNLAVNEAYWEAYRVKYFPSHNINLNPGTLGTLSVPVKNARSEKSNGAESFPLAAYEQGRKNMERIRQLCKELWPAPGFEVSVTNSVSQTANLLSLAMLRVFQKESNPPYNIVTTTHEHIGGIGCFQNLPEFEVHYLTDDILADEKKLARKLTTIQPQIAFFSHVYYDTGNKMPINNLKAMVRKHASECKIIIDAAQSIGLYELPFDDADVVLTSTHKWLFGPHGGGLMWVRHSFKNWLENMNWGGNGLTKDASNDAFGIPGGQDFMRYAAIAEALQLYRQAGKNTVSERSSYLAQYFYKHLHDILEAHELKFSFLNNCLYSPVITPSFTDYDPYPLYQRLNQQHIHVKCIKNHEIDEQSVHILRFGIPYFETISRLDTALGQIEHYLKQEQASWVPVMVRR
jgi:UDP-sulfoquinovose synthase